MRLNSIFTGEARASPVLIGGGGQLRRSFCVGNAKWFNDSGVKLVSIPKKRKVSDSVRSRVLR